MPNGDAPPPPDYHEAPYTMQRPDGSVETRVLRTDRPVTHGELSDYVASQGGVYMGPPQAPPPPAAAPAPPPAPNLVQAGTGYDLGGGAPLAAAFAPPPPPVPPSTGATGATPAPQQTAGNVYFPQRSLGSQMPSILGATAFGTTAGALATPLGPEVAMPVAMGAAGVGGGIGEGAQILGEKIGGAEPAEPGSAWSRIVNAATRSATFEGPAQLVGYLPRLAASRAAPVLAAAEELRPILEGTATTAPIPGKAAEAFPPTMKLAQFWQDWSHDPASLVREWNKLTGPQQVEIAGEHTDAMRTVVNTIAQGAKPWSPIGPLLTAGGMGGTYALGHPAGYIASTYPVVREAITQGVPKLLSPALRSPEWVPWLSQLPKLGPYVAEPAGLFLRGASQVVGAENAPAAQTVFPPYARR